MGRSPLNTSKAKRERERERERERLPQAVTAVGGADADGMGARIHSGALLRPNEDVLGLLLATA